MEKHSHILSIIIPTLLSLIFLFVSFTNVKNPASYLESTSIYLAHGNLGDFWNLTTPNIFAFLYFSIIKLLSLVLGSSIISFRFIFIFAGFVVIMLTFHILKNKKSILPAFIVSLITTLILTITGALLFQQHGQNTQTYFAYQTIEQMTSESKVLVTSTEDFYTIYANQNSKFPVYLLEQESAQINDKAIEYYQESIIKENNLPEDLSKFWIIFHEDGEDYIKENLKKYRISQTMMDQNIYAYELTLND